ncbi:hypothetical protein UCD39_26015 [Nitrospirillum sp. BR 11752]|uniref:hypothetical protein n=1 Tax=Nitrospirillum sp. BR 11752 TaxID=3104293 RepID=UPI002E9FF74A|nr:hypothetical protein [Nitrospirillum sp. BR 11752]
MDNNLILVFDGNCQAQHIAAIFSAMEGVQAFAVGGDLGYVPGYNGRSCAYISESEVIELCARKSTGSKVIQVSQSTIHMSKAPSKYEELVDSIITFPHIQLFSIFPDEFRQNFGGYSNANRHYATDLRILEVTEDRAGTGGQIARALREEIALYPLFHTSVHPGGMLTSLLVEHIASKLGILNEDVRSIIRDVRSGEGLNFATGHPVPVEVRLDLKFDWGIQYNYYETMIRSAQSAAWQETLRAADLITDIRFHDSQYWLAIVKASRALGDIDYALLALEKLLSLSRGHDEFWIYAFSFCNSEKRFDLASSYVEQCKDYYRGQRRQYVILSWMAIINRDLDRAVEYASEYHSRAPDRPDSCLALVKSLALTGQIQRARTLFVDSYRCGNIHTKNWLMNNLIKVKETGLDLADLESL